MSKPDPTSPSYRGTIILDASFLIRCATPIPLEYRNMDATPRLHTYLDLLPFLARQGFRIVIPEAISYETADLLRNGEDLTAYFRSSQHRHKLYSKPLMRAISQGDVPNMQIIPHTGPAEVDQFLATLRQAIHGDTDADLALKRGSQGRGARDKIKQAHASFNRDQFGDKAILSYLTAMPVKKDEPVFVFTNDTGLADEVRATSKARAISSWSFLHHLMAAGLFSEMGFTLHATAEELYASQSEIHARMQNEPPPNMLPAFNEKLFESSLLNGLKQLKQDLGAAQTGAAGMKRFKAKFGAFVPAGGASRGA